MKISYLSFYLCFLIFFYACACQVHDCAFFVSIIDDKFANQVLFFQDALTF
jgi:hypothetical protein